MIDRRELLTLGGVLGGLAAAPEHGEAAALGAGQMTERNVQDLVSAIKGISALIAAQHSFAELGGVRKSLGDYLHANSKFPDFVEIGLDVWTAIHDWHIRLQQPLVQGRDKLGRYTMMLDFTVLVLRPDVVPNFIGVPYDQR